VFGYQQTAATRLRYAAMPEQRRCRDHAKQRSAAKEKPERFTRQPARRLIRPPPSPLAERQHKRRPPPSMHARPPTSGFTRRPGRHTPPQPPVPLLSVRVLKTHLGQKGWVAPRRAHRCRATVNMFTTSPSTRRGREPGVGAAKPNETPTPGASMPANPAE